MNQHTSKSLILEFARHPLAATAIGLTAFAVPLWAGPTPDADFFLVGKEHLFVQTGPLTGDVDEDGPNAWRAFAAVIGVNPGAINVSNSFLSGDPQGFDNVSFIAEGEDQIGVEEEFDSRLDLYTDVPNGTYTLNIDLVSGQSNPDITADLTLDDGDVELFADAPVISNWNTLNVTKVTAGAEFDITWDEFMIDDSPVTDEDTFILIQVYQCGDDDEPIFSTPFPGEDDVLDAGSSPRTVTVPALDDENKDILEPGRVYDADILFAHIADERPGDAATPEWPGVDGLAVYFSTTDFTITTSGSAPATPCGAELSFHFFTEPGTLDAPLSNTVTVTLPDSLDPSVSANFSGTDSSPPLPAEVTITAPGNPPSPFDSTLFDSIFRNDDRFFLSAFGVPVPLAGMPNGDYTIDYDGEVLPVFNFPTLDQAGDHHLVIVPTIILDESDIVQSVDWTYLDLLEDPVVSPTFISRIQVRLNGDSGTLSERNDVPGNSLSVDLSGDAIDWNDVFSIDLQFDDADGVNYGSSFSKDGGGGGGPTGSVSGSVNYDGAMGTHTILAGFFTDPSQSDFQSPENIPGTGPWGVVDRPSALGAPEDVVTNGFSFDLPQGDYYPAFIYDVNESGGPDVGEPFVFYNDIYDNQASSPTMITVNEDSDTPLGLQSLIDTELLDGFAGGTATYDGSMGTVDEDNPIIVEAFLNPYLTGGSFPNGAFSNGAFYQGITGYGDYYLRAYYDANGNSQIDEGEPFTIYDGKSTPPADVVTVLNNVPKAINFIFDDTNLYVISVSYAAWRTFWDPDSGDFLDNPDGDLNPNILEYLLGVHPLIKPGPRNPEAPPPWKIERNELIVRSVRLKGAEDSTLVPHFSTDLVTWNPATPVVNVLATLTRPGPREIEILELRYTLSDDEAFFVRLQAVIPTQ